MAADMHFVFDFPAHAGSLPHARAGSRLKLRGTINFVNLRTPRNRAFSAC
jgi:hypothetical protein